VTGDGVAAYECCFVDKQSKVFPFLFQKANMVFLHFLLGSLSSHSYLICEGEGHLAKDDRVTYSFTGTYWTRGSCVNWNYSNRQFGKSLHCFLLLERFVDQILGVWYFGMCSSNPIEMLLRKRCPIRCTEKRHFWDSDIVQREDSHLRPEAEDSEHEHSTRVRKRRTTGTWTPGINLCFYTLWKDAHVCCCFFILNRHFWELVKVFQASVNAIS